MTADNSLMKRYGKTVVYLLLLQRSKSAIPNRDYSDNYLILKQQNIWQGTLLTDSKTETLFKVGQHAILPHLVHFPHDMGNLWNSFYNSPNIENNPKRCVFINKNPQTQKHYYFPHFQEVKQPVL